jgi:predicted nucleic acid-binding protein
VTTVLIDSSVLIKWLHTEGETEIAAARALRRAHVEGVVEGRIIDLALYEVGNALIRALGWPSHDVADQLDDLVALCGAPLSMSAEQLRLAAGLAGRHELTFYDASWAAVAVALRIPLVSADRRLLEAGLGESPTAIVDRLRLPE